MVTRKIKTKILQKFCKHCSVLCEPVWNRNKRFQPSLKMFYNSCKTF